MTTEDVKWVRKLCFHEELHEHTQKLGVFMSAYKLSLASAQLLKEEDVRTALLHWYRKIPNLRLAVRQREDDSFWFCEMPEEKIDFKVTTGLDQHEEYMKQSTTPYDSYNGPLWRVQLQHEPSKQCELPELQEKFPHQYTFIIGTHHAPTDGFSKHRKLGLFMQIINDVIEGKSIDQSQWGFLTDSHETHELVEAREVEFRTNPELKTKISKEIEELGNLKVNWRKIANNYSENPPRNLNINRTLDPVTNKKLKEKFKSVGCSFHTGFCSLVNLALVQMMKDKDIIQDNYIIPSFHAVNCRRYWKSPDKDFAFGNNYGTIRLSHNTPSNVSENLHEYMRNYYSTFHELLDKKRPIDEEIFVKYVDKEGNPLNFNSLKEYSIDPQSDFSYYYLASNMADVTKLIGTGGNHVQLAWFTRSTSIHLMNEPVLFMMHSFRGQLIIGVDYSTRYVSTEVIEEFVDRIVMLCQNFIE